MKKVTVRSKPILHRDFPKSQDWISKGTKSPRISKPHESQESRNLEIIETFKNLGHSHRSLRILEDPRDSKWVEKQGGAPSLFTMLSDFCD